MMNKIRIFGARENNIRNVDVEIPRDQFVVLTGVSGSGKSSLAFDTLYAEGQRRYVESLSTHARQFLNQMGKPDVDSIEGLSPSISIHQRVSQGNPRSTVGTATEIYDFLRLLFARVGQAHCPECGIPIHSQTPQEIVDQISERNQGQKIQILSPAVKNKKGTLAQIFKELQKAGFLRARVDGRMVSLDEKIELRKHLSHEVEVVIDRLTVNEKSLKRLSESVKVALDMGHGVMSVVSMDKKKEEWVYSELNACQKCSISLGALMPGMFSFNSPYGACECCHGLGEIDLIDEDLMVKDEMLSINQGALPLVTVEDTPMVASNRSIIEALSKKFKIDLDLPWKKIEPEKRDILLNGSPDAIIEVSFWRNGLQQKREEKFEGFRKFYFDRFHSTEKVQPREIIKRYMSKGTCFACGGKRLKKESLAVRVDRLSIIDVTDVPIRNLPEIFKKLVLTPAQKQIGKEIISEVLRRVHFLIDVGLGYLNLARKSNTLAGGEAQRIKLATQIGSGLMGVVYILDEPSIGLHNRDNGRLLNSLIKLKELGNSVIVVEHDEDTIASAEHIIEMGPGAGTHGGEIVFQGSFQEMLDKSDSKTALYMKRKLQIPVPKKRRSVDPKKVIKLTGCEENNLKNISIQFPLNCFVVVTGVSGSGKSSLVNKILHKALQKKLSRAKVVPGKFKNITGYSRLESVIDISQSAIGRTPRSNPATYTGVFDLIRDWYANLPEAKIRGFKASHFSFNVRGGRCEACKGDGMKRIEMHFLPDVYVPCEVCGGKRYDREILEVKYQGKHISHILDSTVEEALVCFKNVPHIREKLELLRDVGLSYIKLGQPATTLSGGEAQRVKLASELGNRTKGNSVYILDEPTTGLHFADIHNLLEVLQRLVEYGHSIIVIEHNMEVIYSADYVIDMGPEGGDEGGKVVAMGTPEEVSQVEKSHTGYYLKKHIEKLDSFKKS